MRFWLDLGVDGYRIDVINWFIKDEQFRSNPYRLQLRPPDYQKHIHDRNRPETHGICREIRKVLDAYPDRFALGEVFANSAKDAASYYGDGDELHMAFNADSNLLLDKKRTARGVIVCQAEKRTRCGGEREAVPAQDGTGIVGRRSYGVWRPCARRMQPEKAKTG
jgi:glycosidase